MMRWHHFALLIMLCTALQPAQAAPYPDKITAGEFFTYIGVSDAEKNYSVKITASDFFTYIGVSQAEKNYTVKITPSDFFTYIGVSEAEKNYTVKIASDSFFTYIGPSAKNTSPPAADKAGKPANDNGKAKNMGDTAKGNIKLATPTQTDLPGSETQAMMGKAKPHGRKLEKLVSIQLLKAEPRSGAIPFNLADVRDKIDPEHHKTTAAPKAHEQPAPATTPHPSVTEHVPTIEPPTTPPVVSRSVAAPAGFSCADKPDGNYCKDANTQVFCYHNSIANTQHCASGCDSDNGMCNSYKP